MKRRGKLLEIQVKQLDGIPLQEETKTGQLNVKTLKTQQIPFYKEKLRY